MTNLNRSLRIFLGDQWRQHARMVPVGITPLGTVARKDLLQAFGRDESGNYWAFGTGRPEPLPQAKIDRAISAIILREATTPQTAENDGLQEGLNPAAGPDFDPGQDENPT